MTITVSTSRSIRTAFVLAGLGLAGAMAGSPAFAGCAGIALPQAPSARMLRDAPAAGGFMSAIYRPGEGRLLRVLDDHRSGHAPIVGTWRFSFTSDGTAYPITVPAGAPVDFGTQQWHDDGTEFMISGERAPSTGDVCMGAWEQTGPNTYKLKHIALAYKSSDTPPTQGGPVVPAAFVGPAIIGENLVLSPSGDTFSGSFTLDQYAQDEVTLLEHIAGTVSGKRFSVD